MEAVKDLQEFSQFLDNLRPRLSKSHKLIADYLLENYEHAAFLSAAQLAKDTGTSEATVVRFASALGFSDYSQFRQLLQQLFRSRVSPALRMINKISNIQEKQDHVLVQFAEMEAHYIREVAHSISLEDFNRAVLLIANAKRVFVFGTGASKILTELLQIRLHRFGIHTIAIGETGRDMLEKMVLMKQDDVLIANGFLKLNAELAAVLKHAQQAGTRRILLTDIDVIDFSPYADIVFQVRRGPTHTFRSQAVPMTILNAFILALAMEKPEEKMETLRQLEQARELYGLDPMGDLS